MPSEHSDTPGFDAGISIEGAAGESRVPEQNASPEVQLADALARGDIDEVRRLNAERRAAEEASIKLVNADNGQVITQLTHADLVRLHRIVAPDDLADKLALFAAFLEGENRVRGRRS